MSLLTQPNELSKKTIYSGLVYGQPGIGKTTLALSSSKPVCIDVDKGMYRVEKRYQVPSLQVDTYQQIIDLINSDELKPFDTIVIDTLGKLIDRISDYVCLKNPKFRQGDGTLAMKGWGAVKISFGQLIKLIQGKNKSVIFVAHESEEKDGEKTKKRPDVSGSARKDIVKELDWMGYMEASGTKRTICFNPSDSFYAKNSAGLEGVIEVPDIKIGNTFVQDKIVKAIIDRQEKDNEMLIQYNSLKSVIDDKIGHITNKETLQAIQEEIATLEVIWDSKIYAWNALVEKAKTINLTWDKASKEFVEA